MPQDGGVRAERCIGLTWHGISSNFFWETALFGLLHFTMGVGCWLHGLCSERHQLFPHLVNPATDLVLWPAADNGKLCNHFILGLSARNCHVVPMGPTFSVLRTPIDLDGTICDNQYPLYSKNYSNTNWIVYKQRIRRFD